MENEKMKTYRTMAAMLGAAGLAAGAAGGLPVHRDLVRPITYYDEEGRKSDFAGAPDLAARQVMMDAKAREGLLGKETLVDLTFQQGGSVFGPQRASAGGAYVAEESSGRTRGAGESDKNWLVQSLKLPSLGQATSNAAMGAIAATEAKSGWGWLADEVATKTAEAETVVPGETEDTALGANPAATGRNPFQEGTGGRGTEQGAKGAGRDLAGGAEGLEADGAARGAEGAPEPVRGMGWELPVRDGMVPGGGDAGWAGASAVAGAKVGDMPRTRQLLAELSGGAGVDFGKGWQGDAAKSPAENRWQGGQVGGGFLPEREATAFGGGGSVGGGGWTVQPALGRGGIVDRGGWKTDWSLRGSEGLTAIGPDKAGEGVSAPAAVPATFRSMPGQSGRGVGTAWP